MSPRTGYCKNLIRYHKAIEINSTNVDFSLNFCPIAIDMIEYLKLIMICDKTNSTKDPPAVIVMIAANCPAEVTQVAEIKVSAHTRNSH